MNKLSLTETHPEIATEWHSTKNGKLTPNDVTAGSNKKVWWKCYKGKWPDGSFADDHEWDASISHRTNESRCGGCPCCSVHKVVPSNCLTTTHPEVAAQWHPTKNGKLTSDDVRAGSIKKIWWKCSKGNHEWYATVNSRTNSGTGGSGCPCCGESKGEKKIRLHLESNSANYEAQFSAKVGRFDFVLPKQKTIIEYNGEQHYLPINFGSKGKYAAQENLIDNIKRDHRKYEWCKKHNLKLMIIPFWEYNRIEKILEDFNLELSDPPEIVQKHEAVRKKIKERLGIRGPEILAGMLFC